MKTEFQIVRVDSSPVWFKEYGEDGKTEVTTDKAEAMRLSEGEAAVVLYDLKQERGGVWSIRKAVSE
jgi:hypothetical protein